MNRVIKFRVWTGKRFWFFDITSGFNNENNDKFSEPMQYTGLKDKNGVEIYEGDICDQKYKWQVKFKNGCFWAETAINPAHNNRRLNDVIKSRKKAGVPIEVIGNIYEHKLIHENPDLLSEGEDD